MAKTEKTDWQDLRQGRIELHLSGGEYRIAPHAHPHFELLLLIEGARRFRMDGRTYCARGGDLIVFRPGDVHEEWAGSSTISYFTIRFDAQALAGAAVEFPATERIGPVVPLPDRERFRELLARMLAEKESPGAGSELYLGACLVEFIVLLRRAVDAVLKTRGEDADGPPPRTRIRTAVETIQRNVSGRLDLEALARAAFMSVSHFAHVFKKEVGDSPKSFLIKERIERAKDLLKNTDKPAQEIAQNLGYESPYFFYRQFKQRVGMTTAEFRARAGR